MPGAPRTDDIYSITKENAVKIAQKKCQDLFGEQREKLYNEIWTAASSGKYRISFLLDERVCYADTKSLKEELVSKGFETELNGRMNDCLEISWYPNDRS